jgi:hypothetical protein
MKSITCNQRGRLSLERILFGLAGTVILVGVVLTVTVSLWFAALPLFVVANMWLYSLAGDCPTSMLLRKLLPVERPSAGKPA